MTIVYICTVIIFILSFLSNMINHWKHPYFNIGKEDSGKNGVLIRNLFWIGTLVIFLLCAVNVGRTVHEDGFLYIAAGYVLGILFGSTFAKRVLNRKYKDVVYESYYARLKREADEQEAAEAAALAAAEAEADALCEDPTEADTAPDEGAEERGPKPVDHTKDHPWE